MKLPFGNRPPENIHYDEVIRILKSKYSSSADIEQKNPNMIRELNKNTSIRLNPKGRMYVFFKTPKMKKPSFKSIPDGITEENVHTLSIEDILTRLNI